jgi:hypothetical protein
MSALALSDLREIDGEACVQDLRLAEALGYARPATIRDLIKSITPDLLRFGIIRAARIIRGKGAGRPATEYYLNRKQVIWLIAKSEAALAKDALEQVVEVFDSWLQRGLSAFEARSVHSQIDPQAAAIRREVDRMEAITARMEASLSVMVSVKNAALAMEAGDALPGARYLNARIGMSFCGGGNSRFRRDEELVAFVMSLHRKVKMSAIHAAIIEKFGTDDVPSRSALGRFLQKLDVVAGLKGVESLRGPSRKREVAVAS